MLTIEEQRSLVREWCKKWKARPDIPMSSLQLQYPKVAPTRGPFCISRTYFPAPHDASIHDALQCAFERLKSCDQQHLRAQDITMEDVSVEWIGYRLKDKSSASESTMSERQKYAALERACEKDTTILYVHGGAFYAGSPTTSRAASTRLASLTKCRIAALSYRLAPQNPFPAALLDVLVAYLSILYPPIGSFHTAVSSKSVVLAGDSAGANLCLALIAILLELQRSHPTKQPTVTFHGNGVPLKLPAGISLLSAWTDLSDALPSWTSNGEFDILEVLQPPLLPSYPPDNIWPSTPPRGHPYCDASLLDHPLISPAAMRDWSGAPPIWFGIGSEERGIDGAKLVAAQAVKNNVSVLWDEYQGMCHEFAMLIKELPQSSHCFGAWAAACMQFTSETIVLSRGRSMAMPQCVVRETDMSLLDPLPFEEALKRMKKKANEHMPWNGSVYVKASL